MTESAAEALAGTLASYTDTFEQARAHIEGNRCEAAAGECEFCREYPDDSPQDAARRYLEEMPLEVVQEVGTPLAVVLGVGGPHVEIVKDTRGGLPYLAGYWGSERAERHGEVWEWALAYYMPEL